MESVYALFVHGVGTQDSKFADFAQEKLAAACSKRGATLYARSVHWAPLMDLTSKAFLKDVQARGSSDNPTQKLVTNTLSDALVYRPEREVGKQILGVYDYEVSSLRGEPVYIFAHSLGGLISLDYLRSRAGLKVAKLVTFGCNVPLFYLGANDFVCPHQVSVPGTWTNLFYASDMLGYPVAGCRGMSHVEDVHLPGAPGLHASTLVPGLSHVDYFSDSHLWEVVAPAVIGL